MITIPTHHLSDAAQTDIPFGISPLKEAPPDAFSKKLRRHSFFLVIWIEAGEGANVIDFEPYALKPGQLYLVGPGQIQYWEVDSPPKGFYIMFTEALFLLFGNRFLQRLNLFESTDSGPVIEFPAEETEKIGRIMRSLLAEKTHPQTGWIETIVAYLQLLLILAERRRIKATDPPQISVEHQLTRQFQQLVQEQAIVRHDLTHYADQLGVSAAHLSETVQAITGTSAGDLIHDRLLLEAKRLLAHSDQSINKISDQLKFSEPSTFTRFFRQETGQTPTRFRQAFVINRE